MLENLVKSAKLDCMADSARPGGSFHRDRDPGPGKAKFAGTGNGTGSYRKCNIPGPGIPNSRSRYIWINMTGSYREKERPGLTGTIMTGTYRDKEKPGLTSGSVMCFKRHKNVL